MAEASDVVDYVLGMIGLASSKSSLPPTDLMKPAAQAEYKKATGGTITGEEEPKEPKNLGKTPEGQVNLESNKRREELDKQELVKVLAMQKAIADKARRGEYK